MLHELNIEDFAIIDRLRISFSSGFNVLTGETGAGKSIIIDALGALLGEKVGSEAIRTGAAQARVEGVFALSPGSTVDTPGDGEELRAMLRAVGCVEDDGTVIISRDINPSGRSVCRLNGRAVPVTVLQQVGTHLVDIHGQSDHLSLLRASEQLNMLDRYAGQDELRAELRRQVTRLSAVKREMSSFMADDRERVRRSELLRYQADEIAAARLRVGEEEELQHERTLLSNAERLMTLADEAYMALYGGVDERGGPASIVDALAAVVRGVTDLARLDPALQGQLGATEDLLYRSEDLAKELRHYRDGIENDPARLVEVENRLELLYQLKRKYGGSVAEILAFGEQVSQDLADLERSEERLTDLQAERDRLLEMVGSLAGRLSCARVEAGGRLGRAVERAMAELNMPGVRFSVSVAQREERDGVRVNRGEDQPGPSGTYAFDASGIDQVEFLLSPNPGEALKPLGKIASGGETARLMLALKSILSAVDVTPTLVFDEIDVGIGGRSAQVVGEKLWRLTGEHQVFCITHLPQIAAFGDAHFRIAKHVVDGHTRTAVVACQDDARVEELAAMLGGTPTTERTIAAAREILEQADSWKLSRRDEETGTGLRHPRTNGESAR